jgi:hypothetical protein
MEPNIVCIIECVGLFMVGWSLIIVVVIDTFRTNFGWTDPIIEIIIECFRASFSMTEPNNCTRH